MPSRRNRLQHNRLTAFRGPAIFLALILALLWLSPAPALAATEKEILAQLKSEEGRAEERKSTLSRLTEQERSLHANLAAVEDNILRLEKNLAAEREKLRQLAQSGQEVQGEYDRLLKEKRKSEQAMAEIVRTLWELHSRRQSVGGRDIEEWTVTDREYHWSAELFKSLDDYRDRITEQERLLDDVVYRRNALRGEIMASMEQIEKEKASILGDRIKFEQSLTALRKQKSDAQAELNAAIKLISNLNFDLKNARVATVDIDKAKGKLLWPTSGKISIKYKSGNPPVQGLGFATSGSSAVRAVHAGRVMYNDTMRGLGQVVVVQHGSAYFTVYAFLSSSSVRQGQNVARGQDIGKTGYYPALKANGLYFELRHHQTPVNPEPWLSASAG